MELSVLLETAPNLSKATCNASSYVKLFDTQNTQSNEGPNKPSIKSKRIYCAKKDDSGCLRTSVWGDSRSRY
jgi:hypothetical protein